MASDIPPSVLETELPPGVTKRTVAVDCEHVEKLLHLGVRDQFVILSDEPPRMGRRRQVPASADLHHRGHRLLTADPVEAVRFDEEALNRQRERPRRTELLPYRLGARGSSRKRCHRGPIGLPGGVRRAGGQRAEGHSPRKEGLRRREARTDRRPHPEHGDAERQAGDSRPVTPRRL